MPRRPRAPQRIRLLAAAIALAGCSDPPPADTGGIRRWRLELAQDGLSGLTVDDRGTLWAVAERDAVIVAIERERVTRVVPLRGVPEGVDLEAIAWVEGARFVVGSEASDPGRAADQIFDVEIVGDEARITATRRMPYAEVGARPDDNDGIEGLCHVDGALVAALENPTGRVATLAVHREGEGWSGRSVRLTTEIGKLSALSCRATEAGVAVWALERGLERSIFGDTWVARVLAFPLPVPGEVAAPRVVARLEGHLEDRPNPEGLAVVGDAAFVVIDNHYRVRTGDNALLRVPLTGE